MPVSSSETAGLLAEYDTRANSYDEFRRTCETLLAQLLQLDGFRVHSVTSRLKTRKSLAGKLEREGKAYSSLTDVTDVVGLRVITHFEDEVDRIGSLIEREFAVDHERSIDKRTLLDPDRFGYLSLHYICGLSPARLELAEHRACSGLVCEIQVRSILQHAWAEIEHDLGYKGGTLLPPHIRRRFSRLAGMLEVADAEFSRLRDDIEAYGAKVAADLEKREIDVPIDPISLRAFIRKDTVVRNLERELTKVGYRLRGTIETVKTVGELRHLGFTELGALRRALHKERGLLAAFWRTIPPSETQHSHLPHGVSLWHFFQLMAADGRSVADVRKSYDEFRVGNPSTRAHDALEKVRFIRRYRRMADSPSTRRGKSQLRPNRRLQPSAARKRASRRG